MPASCSRICTHLTQLNRYYLRLKGGALLLFQVGSFQCVCLSVCKNVLFAVSCALSISFLLLLLAAFG